MDMHKSVIDALADQKRRTPNDDFTPVEIVNIVEQMTGQKPALDEVNAILREQWGRGIEPVTIGGGRWKFGPGKPPRSQQIP